MELVVVAIVIGIFSAIINSAIKKEEVAEAYEDYESKRKNELRELIESRKERKDLEPFDNDKFWNLIDSTRSQANGSYSNQLGLLNDRLLNLTPEQIIQFDNKLQSLHKEARTWNLFGVSTIVFGNNSLDSLLVLQSWLISRGEVVFNNCISDHDLIANHDFEDVDGRLLVNLTAEAYYKKKYEFIPITPEAEFTLEGIEWVEKDLPSRFKNIWNKFA